MPRFCQGIPGSETKLSFGLVLSDLFINKLFIEKLILGTREQFNILAGVIDGNTVYGGTEEEAR